MNDIEEAIVKLDAKLKGVPFDFAFLGGSLLTLLVTDKSADAIRVTKDVDIMMNIRTRKEYHAADAELERRGFRHDTREGAPICRWILDDLTVDVLPIREDVLGWNSKWFEEALKYALFEANAPISGQSILSCSWNTVSIITAYSFYSSFTNSFYIFNSCNSCGCICYFYKVININI